jgi:hypothetical protein
MVLRRYAAAGNTEAVEPPRIWKLGTGAISFANEASKVGKAFDITFEDVQSKARQCLPRLDVPHFPNQFPFPHQLAGERTARTVTVASASPLGARRRKFPQMVTRGLSLIGAHTGHPPTIWGHPISSVPVRFGLPMWAAISKFLRALKKELKTQGELPKWL